MDTEKMMMQKRIDNLSEMLEKYQDAIVPSLRERIEKLERERDALMYDMQLLTITNDFCCICKHCDFDEDVCSHASSWDDKCFAWRGLCKENGGKDDD